MGPSKREVLEGYILGKTLGCGAFSEVKLCHHKETGKKYAVKIVEKKLLLEKREEARNRNQAENDGKGKTSPSVKNNSTFEPLIYGEVQLLMRLMHPNVVKIHQYTETQEKSYMIMDYAPGGELIRRVLKHRGLPEESARKYFREILSAVDHCHLSNVVHRDIKLENILLDENDEIIITDFGFGRLMNPNPDQLLETFCGTPNYAAAELVTGIQYSGVKSDVWSLGVVLFFMTAGRPPFVGKDINSLYTNIKLIHYTCPPHFSLQLKTLLSKIFVRNPADRIDMDNLRSDPWVNEGYSDFPPRVMPIFCPECDNALGRFISGIFYDKGFTTFTFYKYEYGHHYSANTGTSKPNADIKGCPNSNLRNDTKRCSHRYTIADTSNESYTTDNEHYEKIPNSAKRASMPLYDAFRNGEITKNSRSYTTANNSLSKIERNSVLLKNREMFFTCRMSAIGSISLSGSHFTSHEVISSDATPIQILENNFLLNTLGSSTLKTLVPTRPQSFQNSQLNVNKTGKKLSIPAQECDLTMFNVPTIVPYIFGLVPTLSEIKNWHAIHKPPREIRKVPLPIFIDVAVKGTPHAVFRRLYYYILATKSSFSSDSTVIRFGDNYVICCKIRRKGSCAEISAEVLKVLLSHKTCGILFKRIRGDTELFKNFRSKVINLMKEKDA